MPSTVAKPFSVSYKYITVSTHKNKKLAKKALAKRKRLDSYHGRSKLQSTWYAGEGHDSKIVKA